MVLPSALAASSTAGSAGLGGPGGEAGEKSRQEMDCRSGDTLMGEDSGVLIECWLRGQLRAQPVRGTHGGQLGWEKNPYEI